ncbi:hypothetical protein V6N13_043428 [Hibiscus sabdariffa]|uniref:Uncharacterized protein n=1 Tax=Hibiscus sabdariffa TaxID=183260 RepID=A0ABR2G2A3_9ROSI
MRWRREGKEEAQAAAAPLIEKSENGKWVGVDRLQRDILTGVGVTTSCQVGSKKFYAGDVISAVDVCDATTNALPKLMTRLPMPHL